MRIRGLARAFNEIQLSWFPASSPHHTSRATRKPSMSSSPIAASTMTTFTESLEGFGALAAVPEAVVVGKGKPHRSHLSEQGRVSILSTPSRRYRGSVAVLSEQGRVSILSTCGFNSFSGRTLNHALMIDSWSAPCFLECVFVQQENIFYGRIISVPMTVKVDVAVWHGLELGQSVSQLGVPFDRLLDFQPYLLEKERYENSYL